MTLKEPDHGPESFVKEILDLGHFSKRFRLKILRKHKIVNQNEMQRAPWTMSYRKKQLISKHKVGLQFDL